MTVAERLAAHAREWGVRIDELRETETSQLAFGTQGVRPVVLKVIRIQESEEWRCGEVLAAFGGQGMILPIAHVPGAVLLPRLIPGHDLVSLCHEARDEEATDILVTVIERMPAVRAHPAGGSGPERLRADFDRFRDRCRDWIPLEFADRASELCAHLCATQRNVRLVHGDLHHFNVLHDVEAGWLGIDPWGVMAEIEFEVAASLRNPLIELVGSPPVLARRLRIYERRLKLDGDRALKWAFVLTVLCVIWPFNEEHGLDLRRLFSAAAHSIDQLMG